MMNTFKTLTLAAVLACTPSMAVAQETTPAKETPPAGGTPRPFVLPSIEEYSLGNGLAVTLVPYGNVPKVSVRAVVQAGNLNDGDQPWIADVAAGMMEEGSDGKSASELAAAAASMGGDFNLGVGMARTFATMDVLSENAGDAVGLIAGVLQRPNFPEAAVAKVKANVARRVSIARTRAQSIADEAFDALMYPGHPYGAPLPTDEQLQSYTIGDVQAFHAANFGAKRTHVYVVGQFDAAAVKAAIETSFGGWAAGPDPLVIPTESSASAGVVLIDRPGAPQSTIRLGKRVPAIGDDIRLEAVDTLLGGYFSSRITRNIREDKGYTYSPFSQVATNLGAANWQQNADVTTEATGPALTEIVAEIRRLQNEAPSAAEVEGIKNYMNGIFVIRLASRQGFAGQLSFVDLHGLGTDYLSNYVGRVQALTAEDFSQTATEYLAIEDMALVVVGPTDTVREQLSALPDFADRLP